MASTVGNDLVSTFTIRELTGDQRTLTLRDRALPYRPFELSGSQRNSIDWYPGSPIGTLQVFGAREEPTTIMGAWKDKFLQGSPGSAPAEVSSAATVGVETLSDGAGGTIEAEIIDTSSSVVRTARDLVSLVDDMRRKGQEIEVTWLNQVRRGIIDRFTARWQTGHDVEWELAFLWISQGESLSEIAMQSDSSDLGDIPNRVQAKVDELTDDAAQLVPQAGDRFADINTNLRSIGAEIQKSTDELTDMVVQAANSISMPGESLRRAAGILDGLKLSAELMWAVATNEADGIALDSSEFQGFGLVLAQRGEVRERADAATELRNLAAREEVRLIASMNSDVIRVFQARDNQDLREVSQTYFGTPDEWRSLMIFNHLTTSKLTAGQVVFVPARPTGGEC